MTLQFVMRITFLLLLILMYGLAEADVQPGPDCPAKCGNVSIPFPFGIGYNCNLNELYDVVCNKTSFNPPKPFIKVWSNHWIEVMEIDVSYNRLRVKSPIIYSNCPNRTYGLFDLGFLPFVFADSNQFTAVGCDNFATMGRIDPLVVGCVSNCNTSNANRTQNREICSSDTGGFNCCQSTIPSDLKVFEADFRPIKYNAPTVEEPCKYAFLVEKDWFNSNIKDFSSLQQTEYFPVVLDWYVLGSTGDNLSELLNPMGYTGDNFRGWTSSDSSSTCVVNLKTNYTFSCRCDPGYQGNPYLLAGCKDIDECANPMISNKCRNPLDCVNIPGDYTCDGRKSGSKMIIIAIISTILGAIILVIVTWWLYKLIKKRNEIKLKKKFFKKNGGLLLQQQLSSSEGNIQNTKLFNSEELENATDHFNENRILGQGGQGTVYKGMLVDGRIVAIKKSKIVDEANLQQFANEIVILSQVIHRNVVKLLGCCLETEVPLLVYEFIPNGTLYQYIHDQNEDFPLTWNVRLRIATEVARSLSYLHSAAALPIYHRDIKSTNILLDDKYTAKVADFGTSRSVNIDQTHLTTLVHGTFGYLDPEYFQTSQFTEKSDVYSFGVVLVELLTGEKPVSSTRSQESRSLAAYFILSMKENRLFDILVAQVMNEDTKGEVMVVANLAKKCLNLNGKKRPTMREITIELEEIQKASNVQQNYEEFEYGRTEEIEPWDFVSTSTGSGLESDMTSSSQVLPLLSLKSL